MTRTGNMTRLHSLDYLRGLMAISVMLYHYTSWSVGSPDPSSLLGKLGIYAVSLFYILSGLSLSFVFFSVGKPFSLKEFVIKRAFRIIPIFWLCLIFSLVLRYLQHYFISGDIYQPEWGVLFLNFSLLFGFFMPDQYMSIGAWSIGNEVVFYTIFPLIIYACTRFGKVMAICCLCLSLLPAGYFAFVLIDVTKEFSLNWSLYVNPLNQLFLFVSGICIAIFFKPDESGMVKLKRVYTLSLIILVGLFIYVPVGVNSVDLMVGMERVILSTLSILIVLNVYIFQFTLKGWLNTILLFFGKCCYSIYLIHPIVAFPLSFLLHDKLGVHLVIVHIISAVVTFIASAIIYNRVELPMINIGKKLAVGDTRALLRIRLSR